MGINNRAFVKGKRRAWKNGRTNLTFSTVIRSFMGMASGCCPMVSSSKGTSYTARSRPQWRLEARSVAISIGDQQFSNVARALVSGKKRRMLTCFAKAAWWGLD